MNRKIVALFLIAVAVSASVAVADTVTLKNGDKLTGKIGTIVGGKMAFTHESLGDITIDLANVASYSTDEPARIQTKTAVTNEKITEGNADKVTTADGKTISTAEVKTINPPPMKWTGSLVGNFALRRGNTDTLDAGLDVLASLRRDDPSAGLNDRFTLGGGYHFGTSGIGDDSSTNTDNWNAGAKYDKFFNEKLYGYVGIKVEHDRIALLNYRIAPGVGIGYQWWEGPISNFNTEAGLSYVFEDYSDNKDTPLVDESDSDDHLAVRLAYHYDRKFNDKVMVFHNLEYLPAIDDPGDYNLLTDIGIRATLTKNMFAQARFEWKRDSTPAQNSEKNDLGYFIGIGWTF